MIEIAVRVKELASSNLNHLVDKASSPTKMLKLLTTELEEAIIALSRDATHAERLAGDCIAEASGFDRSAATWEEKAKLALSHNRDDLARGALAECQNARDAAATKRTAHDEATVNAKQLRSTLVDLETKLLESRVRLKTELAAEESAPSVSRQRQSTGSGSSTDKVMDRIATLEKRIDFACASAPDASAASLDQKLAEITREASIDAELEMLRKAMKKKK